MTTSTMHPVVLDKLQRFSRQRRRLILLRGLCGTLAIWLGAMMAVALVDRFVLMPDALRLSLSLAGYVATAAVFWFECGRQLMHRPDPRELARLLELAAPQLREELLSAVELSESDLRPHWDSDEFRAALQQAAARDVGNLPVEGLLTRKLIAGWLYAAVAVGVVLAVLFAVPGLRFTQSFARAVLPAANLARFSTVQITVVAPTPPDQIVPDGDSVPVTVVLGGADVQQVILETIPHRGATERIPMLLSSANQFTAAVQLRQDPVQFRIRAHDAITRKYTLTPRPRPHVVRFQKTYRYPAYSRLPARTVTEENGDLDALEGTEVELNLDVDQPIKEASLQIEGNTKTEIPLGRDAAGRLIARVPLTAAGIYQVHLVAAQTGFENKFSPQYEIRVHADLLPFAKIDRPEKDQILPPDSVVNLTGSAKDDLGLAAVEQAVQINRGEWKMFPLTQTTNAEAKVTRTWDLFELGAHPGDHILTKLIATDLKGQRGESAPVRILIASAGFDPARHKELQQRQALNQSIHELRDAVTQMETKTLEARTAVNSPTADPLQKQQALLAAATATAATDRKAEAVLRQIKDALPQAASARESADLALIGTAISRAQHTGVAATQAALDRAIEQTKTNDHQAAKAEFAKITEPLGAANVARVAADTHRQMLAAAEAAAAGRDLHQLGAEQRALTDQLRTAGPDANQTERATHRLAVAADQAKSVEQQLKTLSEHTFGNPVNIARNFAQDLARNRENLEKALTAEPTVEKLKAPAEQLQRSVDNAATAMRNVEAELAQRVDAARNALQNQTGTAADALTKLAAADAQKPESWQAAVAQLKDRAALEERRPQANAQFPHTVARTADALQAVQDAGQPVSNTVASVKAIEQALRKLQAGQALDEQVAALRQLSAQELWEKTTTPTAVAERANDYKWTQQQLQALPPQLDRAQLPVETKRALDAATKSPAAQQIATELNQRRLNPQASTPVAEPLAQLAGDIAQVKEQLQPALDQARAEIEKNAPALSDRLAGLARTADKLKTETAAQAQLADKPENTNQVRAEAQALATAQKQLDNRIDDVKDALRRDANAQNLATEDGRARARDADDAAAILRQKPTPNANELLQRAAAATQPEKQQSDLKGAAAQQAKLADDLKQLAEHYKNAEAGTPELTRQALREVEKELGLKPTLDAEYAKAQALENLAGLIPEQQLAELEKALQDNKPMRHELSNIAHAALESATSDLQKAADQEQQIVKQPLLDQAKRLAAEAQKLARQDVPAVAQKAGATAKPELAAAGQRLAAVAQNIPQAAAKPAEQLAQALQNQVAPLQQAANDLNTASAKLEQAAQTAQEKVEAAAQTMAEAKANNAGEPAVKQAEAAHQQAQTAAEQTQAAQKQAQQASQQADRLASEAGQLASALNPAPPQEQARQIAAAAKELAQNLPAAGDAAKPELTAAGQKLESVAEKLPAAAGQPAEQLAQALQNQVAPLQQAANELDAAANKLAQTAQEKTDAAKTNPAAAPEAKAAQAAQQQAQQAAQQANQLAQQAGQLAKVLNQDKPQQQAKHIAAEAQKLAQQNIPAVAAKAGETAQPELSAAGQKLASVAKNTPQDFAKPPEQLAQALQNQVAPLEQAATELNAAAAKLDQAAQAAQQQAQEAKAKNAGAPAIQQAQTKANEAQAARQEARQASQQATQLAQQAGQLAQTLNQANAQPPPTVEKAKQIAAEAQKLARQELPALTAQAAAPAKPELNTARQKLDGVAQNTPQDFTKPPEQLVQQMQNQVAPLQQAATDLNKAAAKLAQAAQAAEQKAGAAAAQLETAKSNNASEAALKQAETAQQQAQAAAQQAQANHQQAQQAGQQAAQLAQQAGELAAAMEQTKLQIQAVAQQPAIEQAVRAAGNDIERAGRHEARLGQEGRGQELQQLGQQVETQAGAQIAQAAQAMAQATAPAQIPPAAQAAHDALQPPLRQLGAALEQSPAAGEPSSSETPSQLAAAPDAAAKWLARALDSLDAKLNPTAGPAQPGAESAPAGQAPPSAAALAAQAAAQAQAGAMMGARRSGLAPGEPAIGPAGASAGGLAGGGAPEGEESQLPELRQTAGNWGKLPAKLARDLLDSQREGVGGEYREMVEMYFRAIADKAREQQP